jgi:hypothetical protein
MAAGYGGGGSNVAGALTIEEAQAQTPSFAQINLELKRLLESRRSGIEIVNETIIDIHERTDRAVKGQIANKFEFVYGDGKPVRSGTSYHIHYTRDLKEYFMTGFEHQIGTVLIYPIAPITEFGIYNSINAQTPLTIGASITYPTDKDYENGSYERFFARRANDKRSTGFEVSKSNFQKSPLYIYTSLTWFLTGTSDFVYDKNQEQIEIAKETLPLIYKILNPHQFFIPNNNLTPKELTEQRLGISTSKGDEWVGLTEEELERRRARNQSLESAMTEGGGANIAEQGPPTSGY